MALINANQPWPNANVYYSISSNFLEADEADIKEAMRQWHLYAGYRFQEHTNESNYIKFHLQTDSSGSNYSDSVGMSTEKQNIYLKQGRGVGKIMHEIGHALGLYHEQQRPDAESYIDINWDNIEKNSHGESNSNYRIKTEGTRISDFGYYSLMQYKETSGNFAINEDENVITPYDTNVEELGQRVYPSASDVNGLQAMYPDARIASVHVNITTGSDGTSSKVYLGVAGREFCIEHQDFPFEGDSTVHLVLGLGANVKNANDNDPREPAIGLRDALNLPMYLRLEDDADWDVESVEVILEGISSPSFPEIRFGLPSGAIRLDTTASQFVRLVRIAEPHLPFATQESHHARVIRSIQVTTHTSGSGTDDRVYLGIAGREFRMKKSYDTFIENRQDTFTFGEGHNVSNHSSNDPHRPELRIENVNSNLVYLRKDGNDDWEISAASVVVEYQNHNGNHIGDNVYFDLVNGGFKLTEDGSKCAYFKYRDRVVETVTNVARINVTVNTGNNGTDDPIYLGIGGREFRLDNDDNNFEASTSCNFILGQGSTVSNSSVNNPCAPQLTELDIKTYDIYIRKEGSNNWVMASASISVEFPLKASLNFENYLSNVKLGPDSGQKVFLVKE